MNRGRKMGWKLIGISAVMIPSMAAAVTQPITAQVSFAHILSAAKIDNVDFGALEAKVPASYTMTTSGVIADKKAGGIINRSAKAGSIVIAGSATQNIDIIVENYVMRNDVTPSNAYCSYDGSAAAPCMLSGLAAPGEGKPLLIGLDIAVGGRAKTSYASPTFDVEVRYY